jgi:hypothetical protein
MKTIEISVNDNNFLKLKKILEKVDFIESIKEKYTATDPISMVSEPSLAEEWNSEEDNRYEAALLK